MSHKKKYPLLGLASLLLTAMSPFTHGVSLTSYRIYLDYENRTSSFIIFNREGQAQNCRLSFKNYQFGIDGEIKNTPDKVNNTISAKNWVRFSPRRFTIPAGDSQTVRFALRRKPGMGGNEYRTFLNIDCDAKQRAVAGKISITPKLIHNIPVIARTGKLNANAWISDLTLGHNNSVAFNLNRTGSRSIYGQVQIVDAANDDIISFVRGISIYPESKYKKIALNTNGLSAHKLKIRFIEDTKFGGNIVLEENMHAISGPAD